MFLGAQSTMKVRFHRQMLENKSQSEYREYWSTGGQNIASTEKAQILRVMRV